MFLPSRLQTGRGGRRRETRGFETTRRETGASTTSAQHDNTPSVSRPWFSGAKDANLRASRAASVLRWPQ